MAVHNPPNPEIPKPQNTPQVETTGVPQITDPLTGEPSGPTPFQEPIPQKNDHEGLKNILSTLAILIIAPLIALCLTAFVFQSYEVDGPSMETTLQNQDRLIVLKVPRTWARITRHSYIPNRGDVVIFTKHDLYEYGGQEKQLIKRIVGLPGDRVVVKGGHITIYNKEHPNGFDPDKALPYGEVIKDTSGNVDIAVREGEVFVCGDNRGNSLDSRVFGSIPANDIVGKLGMRIIPFNKARLF